MRLIDADALEKRMYVIPYYDNRDEDAVIDEIYKAPTVDAVPVVRGEWIKVDQVYVKCSHCDKHYYNLAREYGYCPNCGADNRGSEGKE